MKFLPEGSQPILEFEPTCGQSYVVELPVYVQKNHNNFIMTEFNFEFLFYAIIYMLVCTGY